MGANTNNIKKRNANSSRGMRGMKQRDFVTCAELSESEGSSRRKLRLLMYRAISPSVALTSFIAIKGLTEMMCSNGKNCECLQMSRSLVLAR